MEAVYRIRLTWPAKDAGSYGDRTVDTPVIINEKKLSYCCRQTSLYGEATPLDEQTLHAISLTYTCP